MTLIAALTTPGLPFLLGDLLVSSSVKSAQVVALPTTGRVTEVNREKGMFIQGLSQKLTIISDTMAVGWAGPQVVARAVLNDLLGRFSGKEASIAEIKTFLTSLDYPEVEDVSLVGVAVHGSRFETFGWNAAFKHSQHFGRMCAAGSGAQDLFDVIDNLEEDAETLPGELSQSSWQVGKALAVISLMTGQEVNSKLGLDSFYGGGFEIITFDQGKLRKIDDITHLFWLVSAPGASHEVAIQLYPLAIKFKYVDDLLVIRRAKFSFAPPGANLDPGLVRDVSDDLHVVLPAHRPARGDELNGVAFPDLNSSIYCNYMLVDDGSPVRQILTVIRTGGEQAGIKFTLEDKNTGVGIRNDLLEYIARAARRRLYGHDG